MIRPAAVHPTLPTGSATRQFSLRFLLLLGASFATAHTAADAQPAASSSSPPTAAATAPAPDSDDEDIVVTGKPPRGSVIGDIPPVNVLSSRDVKATGATSFDELLDAIAPDIGLARGAGAARPLVLLNG